MCCLCVVCRCMLLKMLYWAHDIHIGWILPFYIRFTAIFQSIWVNRSHYTTAIQLLRLCGPNEQRQMFSLWLWHILGIFICWVFFFFFSLVLACLPFHVMTFIRIECITVLLLLLLLLENTYACIQFAYHLQGFRFFQPLSIWFHSCSINCVCLASFHFINLQCVSVFIYAKIWWTNQRDMEKNGKNTFPN